MTGAPAFAANRYPVELDINKQIRAKSVYLVDAQTGLPIYSRNSTQRLPPASTAKVMTALLVYEIKGLDGTLVVSPQDQAEPSNVPLIPGETVKVRDLMYSLLLGSDNDTALALARYVGGSVPDFIALMNARAVKLGCRDTQFKNPNGLPVSGQYTTTEDLMKIFEAFLSVPELRKIASTKSYYLKTAAKGQTLKNHNKLLGVYAGMGAAKTGWTYSSRHTYAACAARSGRELHLTILDSPNKWNDASALFNYGFAHLPAPTPTTNIASTPPASNPAEPSPVAPLLTPSAPVPPSPIGTVNLPTTTTPSPSIAPVPAPAPAQPPAVSKPAGQTHVIRRGETLSSIAGRYDCTVSELTHVNNIANPRALQIGQKLQIPQKN